MKLPRRLIRVVRADPAAFGRLCVETANREMPRRELTQPPSGGCVLKLKGGDFAFQLFNQPPSGGCVLKPIRVVD